MKRKIKNALISVSDKTDLEKILLILKKNEVNIISSGGTYKKIVSLGFDCTEVSRFTKFKEMLDGSCLLYTSPSPRDLYRSRMPSSA